jgi:hypothetical protein
MPEIRGQVIPAPGFSSEGIDLRDDVGQAN